MTDITEAQKLYRAAIAHFEESNFTPHQARAYRETLAFIDDCKTVEEAEQKLKDSPYYTATAVALMRDKALAHARAARELGMDDVAEVYEVTDAEFAANGLANYDYLYEQKAQELRNRHADLRAQKEAEHKAELERRCAPNVSLAQTEAREAWNAIHANKSEIAALGSRILPTIKCAECIVLPPENEEGVYTYVNQTEETL